MGCRGIFDEAAVQGDFAGVACNGNEEVLRPAPRGDGGFGIT